MAKQVVVMVLDYALIELTVGIASAALPKVIELSLESSRALEMVEVTGTRGALTAGESALGETISVAGKSDRATAVARLESVAGEGTPLTFYPMRPVNEMAPSTARTLAADTEKVSIKPNPPFGKTPTPIETPEAAFIPPHSGGPNRSGLVEARVEAPGRAPDSSLVPVEPKETLLAGGRKASGSKKPEISPILETTESGLTGDLKTDPRSGGAASEIVGIERDGEWVKLNDWFKDLDAVRGGKITTRRIGDKIVVEFEDGVGMQHKATFIDDHAANLQYIRQQMNEAANRLVQFDHYEKTLSGVTHFVKDLAGRELHLVWDQQSIIMNERQLFNEMEKIKVDLAKKGVDFHWYVDSFGYGFEGPRWFNNKIKFYEEL